MISSVSSAIFGIWEMFGMELMIFFLTLVFAIGIRIVPTRRFHVKSAEQLGARVYPSKASGLARACTAEPAAAGQQPEPRRLVDEVLKLDKNRTSMDHAREQEAHRNANRALQLHAQLRVALQERGLRLTEALTGRGTPEKYFSTIAQYAIHAGRPQAVDEIMQDMSRQGVVKTLQFYESLMKQSATHKQYRLALRLFDRLSAEGLEASAVTYSCLIKFAAEVGELDRAAAFFEKLSSKCTPSIRAYMSVLRVHAKREDWNASVDIYHDMQARGVPVDCLVLNIVLATGVSLDKVDEAWALLEEADNKEPPFSDAVSYNTLIKGYSHRNAADSAIRVLRRMQRRGLQPTAITFNSTMDAAVRGGKADMAWELLKEMRNCGLKPDKFTCSTLAKTSANSARPRDFLLLLREAGSSCDASLRSNLHNNLLEASAHANDHETMSLTFAQMRRMGIELSPAAQKQLAKVGLQS